MLLEILLQHQSWAQCIALIAGAEVDLRLGEVALLQIVDWVETSATSV